MTPAEFDKFLQDEIAMNAALVKAAGIKPNPYRSAPLRLCYLIRLPTRSTIGFGVA